MSITVHTGTLDKTNTSGSSTIAVTIPSGANFVYVLVTGYHGNNAPSDKFFDQLSWDGDTTVDFTFIDHNYWSSTGELQCEAWYMDDTDPNWPGTGSKTLYWSPAGISGSTEEGYCTFVGAMSGVHTADDPIVDTHNPGGNVGSPYVATLDGVGANDVSVILGYVYQDSINSAPSGQGQTALCSDLFNNAGIGASYKVGASSIRLEATPNIVGLAFAVKAAADAGGGNPSTVERSGSLLMGAA